MPCHTRMKLLLRGIFWLFILEFGFMVTSLEPGFLDFDNLPDTNFSCVGKVIGGYYADLETSCQMFHVCTIGQLDEPMDIRFLCLNGTVFDQETRVCERIDEVDCTKSEHFYSLNLELYGNTQPPIVEETPETEAPEVPEVLHSVKKSITSTTTPTTRPTVVKTTRPSFIITTSKPPPHHSATHVAVHAAPPVAPIPQPPKPAQPQPQLHFGSRPPHGDTPPADIRFNPEEYKIALSSSGPPSIRTNVQVKPNSHSANSNHNNKPSDHKPISFQTFSDNNKRVIVTTHTTVYKSEKQPLHVVTVAPNKPVEVSSKQTDLDPDEQEESESEEHDYDVELSESTEDNYSYGYRHQQQQPSEALKPSAYTRQGHTETPLLKQYIPDIRSAFRPSQALPPPLPQPIAQPLQQPLPPLNLQEYKASTYRSVFHPASNNPLKISYSHRGPGLQGGGQGGIGGPTTYRNHYGYFNQASIPVSVPIKPEKHGPIRPTIPPLTFSSPAPFSLSRHVETKRFIDHRAQQQLHQQSQQASQQLLHHHQPPRIVISASASVSDASGRKFNYSLGTIGDTRFFGHAPQSYDDYKEDDVGSDPFYHDVPKIRHKRQVVQHQQEEKIEGAEAGEKEAIDVLKFLFSWYNNHEMSTSSPLEKKGIPVRAETITEINDALSEDLSDQYQNDQQALHNQESAKDYLYEEFDGTLNRDQKQPNFASLPQKNDGRPYLSLQLLKPPFPESLEPHRRLPEELSDRRPKLEASIIIQTSTTTTTTQRPEQNYYEYVDDNYEPLAYKHYEDANQPSEDLNKDYKEPGKQQSTNYRNKEYEEPINSEYQTSKEGHSQKEIKITDSYHGEEYNETDPSYSLPEYVDDNYEPIVYQHQKFEKDIYTDVTKHILKNKVIKDEILKEDSSRRKTDVVVTTPETLTSIKEPIYTDDNVNNYYDVSKTVQTTTPSLPSLASITIPNSTKEPASPPSEEPIYPIYNRNQFEEYITTETPPTSVTENYQQVLGILGITTRKPTSIQPQQQVSTKKQRSHGRGKARFSLKDVADVSDDKVFIRKQTIPTTRATIPATLSTKPVEIVTVPPTIVTTEVQMEVTDTTTESMAYTVNVNRRTEEIDFDSVLPTTSMPLLPQEEVKVDRLKEEEHVFMQGVEGRFWEKLGETTITPDITTEEIEVTTEKYTKLVEDVEASTGSMVVTRSETKGTESTTVEVPTTLMDSNFNQEFWSIETTSIPSTITTSFPTTLSVSSTSPTITTTFPTTTTITTSTTTTPSRVKPNSRNSRRRSKSRFRPPGTTTTTTTTILPPTIPTIITTELPSSISFSSTTPQESVTGPSIEQVPTRKPTLNEEIIGAIKNKMTNNEGRNFEFNINAYTANLAYRVKTTPLTLLPNKDLPQPSNTETVDDPTLLSTGPPSTDPPLPRSAQPTLSNENISRGHRLPTTPISQSTAINVRKQVKHRRYIFNCVGKQIDRFYFDPRDCRLFHYCTRGFTKTQYLDMKFVCDLGTFFDDVQLVCTKAKPARCA